LHDISEIKIIEDPQEELRNEIEQNRLFIRSLQIELTLTAKARKIEKLEADSTILELTKQLASMKCCLDEKNIL
jgi:hypothetical protein